MSLMSKIALGFKEDKYIRIFIPGGLIGIICGCYLRSIGSSPLCGAVVPIGFSYLLCGAFRLFLRMFDHENHRFVRFQLALLLLALYGFLVCGTDHFIQSSVPFQFANPFCQFMAFVCAGLALQPLITDPRSV